MINKILAKVFGDHHEKERKRILPIVEQINQIYPTLEILSDDELRSRSDALKDDIQSKGFSGEDEKNYLNEKLPEAFAIVKDACRRLVGQEWNVTGKPIQWNMIPYDVQLFGGVVLHDGKIAEMKTGEGKTLVATMPIYLNALTGKGVHIVTVNDYLAQRDSEWMGKVLEFLGISVGVILHDMPPSVRREQYLKDVVYGTNNEFGFDYLRDNMSISVDEQVQRWHHFAIVDEVDSVLVDEARTPLIISGVVDVEPNKQFEQLLPSVRELARRQTHMVNEIVGEARKFFEDGNDEEMAYKLLLGYRGAPKNKRLIKLLGEMGTKKAMHSLESAYMRDKRMGEIDEQLYYVIEEKHNTIDLSDKGREVLSAGKEDTFVIPDLGLELAKIDEDQSFSETEKLEQKDIIHQLYAERSEKIHNLNQLLRAHSLFERDVDYVVQDGKVQIVDEFTGRVLHGRRYSDGLHQALEAKEKVRVERETQTLATITLQNYFRMYDKIAGMTGTAETEAGEFEDIYDLEVIVIPTNDPVIRDDMNDAVYKTKREKYNAIIQAIAGKHKQGQPVLVGTTTVDVSETLSRMLKRTGIPHNVLNAKQHKREAEVVTNAGNIGAVTIATNMAGRGTDIKLEDGVVERGGLHIIGTERHESRRIDLQLRGRSGRQGDPGSSKFYLSLEDDLMRLFGSDRIASVMDRMGHQEGDAIEHKMITKSIERAQKKVEERNYLIRKHLLEYDDVMNHQRTVIYDRRNFALHGEEMKEAVDTIIKEHIGGVVEKYNPGTRHFDEWDWHGLTDELHRTYVYAPDLTKSKFTSVDEVIQKIYDSAQKAYQMRRDRYGEELFGRFERWAILRTVDQAWKDHLYEMDRLKEGINLRAFGQKDPLVEYKRDSYELFVNLIQDINQKTLTLLYRTELTQQTPQREISRSRITGESHESTTNLGIQSAAVNPDSARKAGGIQPVKIQEKVAPNAPCPCGSGKKFKKCHG
ncbi:MAG: preprotein translocase subunit SecA [Candidatus Marinimicrobia bacterium]|nr:preprotein translocase subunit SecA [Candidatus Neomarinimicrobiota bacterium]